MSPRTFIAIDLETTGLDPSKDAITEVGMVRFTLDKTLERYSQLVNPKQLIPPIVQRLTGITNAEVSQAPIFDSARLEIEKFLGDTPLIGQNISFDLAFLLRQGIEPRGAVWDTLELATLLDPSQQKRSLSALAERYNIKAPIAHRALADAETTSAVFVALYKRASNLPNTLLNEIIRLAEGIDWPPAELLKLISLERRTTQSPTSSTLKTQKTTDGNPKPPIPQKLVIANHPLLNKSKKPPDSVSVTKPIHHKYSKPQIVESVASALNTRPLEKLALEILATGKRNAELFGEFEDRQEQSDMTKAVAQHIIKKGQLIIEAGTGTGKSLAYLIPAALAAMQKGSRVVISTNTLNLQDQLLKSDVPALRTLIADALGSQAAEALRVVTLKGRSNYVCLRRVSQESTTGNESDVEARLLSRILIWLRETESGDREELRLRQDEEALWPRFSADGVDCLVGGHCQYVNNGSCFLLRSRKAAEEAHLVIGNHALLLSDLNSTSSSLLSTDIVIIDEAHHLEDSATRQFGQSFNINNFRDILERIYRTNSESRNAGLSITIEGMIKRSVNAGPRHDELQQGISKANIQITDAIESLERLFLNIKTFADNQQTNLSRYERRTRLTSSLRTQPDWSAIEILWETAFSFLREIDKSVEEIIDLLEQLAIEEDRQSEWNGIAEECSAFREALIEQSELFGELLTQHDRERVAWITVRRNTETAHLEMAPLHVDKLLQSKLFNRIPTVILTGATLTTDESFDYLKQRLGLLEAQETLLGSPFDYRRSVRLLLPNDMPEPNERAYQRSLQETIIQMAIASSGRMLVLFTSHGGIRTTAKAIRDPLEKMDILVAAQGIDGSPNHVMSMLEANDRVVILGTASLWEGVDLPGPAVSVVAIARLPFAVPTDPIHASRSEEYENPFEEFAIPQAVVRLRQGFGRLIRRKDDRGVVAILDGRITGRKYGDIFTRSLPNVDKWQIPIDEFAPMTAEWLES